MIGATDHPLEPGRHEVRIRRNRGEPWFNIPIVVVRDATYDEYVAYHEEMGIPYDPQRDDMYYQEILMD